MQVVDPHVSRAKFDREIADWRAMEASYRKRGAFLISAEFPDVVVLLAAPKLSLPCVAAAVKINFSNYDLEAPSVEFVDPFAFSPLLAKDMRFVMLRRLPGIAADNVALMSQMGAPVVVPLIQANSPDDKPFICLAGIREYHDNPAHTGDPWLLHRNSGEGSLAFILDKILMYGVDLIQSLQLHLQVAGFQIGPMIPE